MRLYRLWGLLLWAGIGGAMTPMPPDLAATVAAFAQQIETDTQAMQGGVVSILYRGRVVYHYAFGHTKNDGEAITLDTIFPIASLSKPIVSMGIARLVKKHRLDLDAPIGACIPGLDPRITTRHLLTHSTGYSYRGTADIERGRPRKALLDKLFAKAPSYTPGTHYEYNNLTYSLTEEVIHCATGDDWRQTIYPLWPHAKTQHLQLCNPPKHGSVAFPHDTDQKTPRAMDLPPYYPHAVCASAGAFAPIGALETFLRLQMGAFPQILSAHDMTPFHTPQIEEYDMPRRLPWIPPNYSSRYALGWRILDAPDPKNRIIYHVGYLKGVNAFMGFMPHHEVGLIILLNEDIGFATKRGVQFFLGLLNEPCCAAPAPGH